jgi:hypothetical protein
MRTALIVIQNEADHADAKKLMGSSDSRDRVRSELRERGIHGIAVFSI